MRSKSARRASNRRTCDPCDEAGSTGANREASPQFACFDSAAGVPVPTGVLDPHSGCFVTDDRSRHESFCSVSVIGNARRRRRARV
ncbi:MAG: hypothetical protein ACJA0V_003978 [Planctomycetota bacterium]|jgi:hypothetical protein